MLRVFEAFSGVGAQCMALRNLEKEYKVVATCDIDESATLAYYHTHANNKKSNKKYNDNKKKEFIINRGIGNKSRIMKMNSETLET